VVKPCFPGLDHGLCGCWCHSLEVGVGEVPGEACQGVDEGLFRGDLVPMEAVLVAPVPGWDPEDMLRG
jgi:hypothetical protein